MEEIKTLIRFMDQKHVFAIGKALLIFIIGYLLIFPALLEIIELKGYKVPVMVPALLVLLGGLIFRFVMVEAGQITRYLY